MFISSALLLKNENSKADLLQIYQLHHWDFIPMHAQRDSLGLLTWLVFNGVALHGLKVFSAPDSRFVRT